jgi:heme-degrading monooxygenase HmoA
MIVRTWRGRADANKADAYPSHFRRNVLPELRGIAGFQGATLMRQDLGGAIEYLVMTRWASMDAVRAFAGRDASQAVVEPEAVAALVSFDKTVTHYEVVEEVSRP